MGRRTLLLITSVLVAAMGVALVALYVRGADARAARGLERVRVLVSSGTISQGQQFDLKSFTFQDLPRAATPSDVVTDTSGLSSDVALSTIYPGQVLIRPMFGASTAGNDHTGVTAGNVALQLQMSDPGRVAGFLSPNSHVIVYATWNDQDRGTTTAVLFQTARVLAVGADSAALQAAGGNATQSAPSAGSGSVPAAVRQSLITLDLTAKQAQRAVLAQNAGTLYFGLVKGDKPPADAAGGPVTLSNLGTQ